MKKLKLFALLAAMFFPLVTHAQQPLTVCEGTTTNSNIPMYGYYNDSRFKNEFIYPARMLADMEGSLINTITFYAQSDSSWNSNLELTIDEVADTSYSGSGTSWKATSDAQLSWTGTCTVTNGEWAITLDEPYLYSGGNLLISIRNTAAGTGCPYSYFYGISSGSVARGGYATGATPSSVSSIAYFLPKATFGYTSGGNVCARVRGMTVSGLLSDEASLTWSPRGTESAWLIYLNGQYVYTSTNDTSYTFSNLTPNTPYTLGVRAYCGVGDTSSMATVAIRTACTMLTNDDMPFTENFNSWTSNSAYFDPCWSRLGLYGTYLPYAYATTGPNGTPDTVLYGYAGNNTMPMFVILPPMEDVAGKMVSFFAKGGTDNYATIQVGYMTNPSDTSTFTAASSTGFMPSIWNYYEAVLPTDDMEDVHYIALRMYNTPYSGYYIYVDDITVGDAPACARPLSLDARDITSNSANLWINDPTENNNYTVKVINGTDTTTVAATDTVVPLNNLAVNTPYQVVVISNCSDGNTTVPITTSFRTSCVAIDHEALPWVANFDSLAAGVVTESNLPCWTVNTSSTAYPSISTTQSHSASKSLLLYGVSTQTIALPSFSNGLSTVQLSFWHKGYYYNGVVTAWVEVGVMSNPSDPATFVPVQVCMPDSNAWTHFDVTFAGYSTGNIAFRYAGTSTNNSIYVDDITIQDVPSCVRPSSVTVSNLTATTATLTIADANNAGSYSVAIVGGDSSMTYSNTLDLDTLSANTSYTVSVRTLCDNGTLTDATVVSFTTACAAKEIPYSNDFENDATDAAPGCWTVLGGNARVNANTTSTSNSHSGSKYVRFYGGTRNMIALPSMDEELSGLQVRFWTRPENPTNSSCGKFQVGYLTNVADTTTFTAVSTWNYNDFTGYEEKEVSMSEAPEGARIAFLQKDCQINWFWFVDDVVVEPIPMCAHPVSVSASNIGTESVDISVNDPDDAYSYRYYLAVNDSIIDSADFYDITYTINDLTANTVYTVSVATVCGDEATGTVSTSFRTGCVAIISESLPWHEDFESYSAASGIIPCWGYLGPDATKMNIVSYGAISGSRSYRFSSYTTTSHIALLPEFEDGISNLMLGFWLKSENATKSSNLLVGYVYDDTVFVQKALFNPADYASTRGYAEVTFANAPDGARIAIKQEQSTDNNYYWWIDDLIVGVATSCERPNGVVVRDITSSGAGLWIDDTTLVNNYSVAVVNGIDTVAMLFPTDTVATLSGLLSGTGYTVYVRALCSDGDSTTAVSTSFFTECEDIATLPWTEGFESWATGATSFNPCWNRIYQSGTYTSTTNHPYVMAGGYDSTANAMRFYSIFNENVYSTSYYYSAAYLPVFQAPVNTLSMSFWYKMSSSYDVDYTELVVGVSSSTADTTTFTRLMTIVPVDNQWHEYDLDFSAYTGTGNRITIMQRNIDGDEVYDYYGEEYYVYSDTYGYLDSITVISLGNCSRPATLVVSDVDTTHATLTWTDVNGTGDYVVTCSNGDSVTVSNALTYSFSNLLPGTSYTVSVRRLCAGELTNARTATFSTLTMPVTVLPYTTGFEAGDDLQWEFAQGNSNVWVIGNATAATGTSSLYISNDNGATNSYNVTSQAVSYAFRTFELEAGEYAVSFDWHAKGEGNYDFLRVFAIPDSLTLTANVFPLTSYATGIPAGWQDVVGGKLNLDTNYTQADRTFSIANAGRYKLVFMWRNDNSGGNAPAAAVDNIRVEVLSCATPANLTFNAATTNSITFSWTPTGGENAWLVSVDGGAWQRTTVTSFTANGLASATEYTFAVRALCGTGDTSFAITGSMRTECDVIRDADLTWEENFDALSAISNLDCWSRLTGLYSGATTALTEGGNWQLTSTAMGGSKHAKLNIYGTSVKHWLVTPTINTVASAVLSFDYALTKFNTADTITQAGNDDRFMVLVTTDNGATWTPVVTWDSVNDAYRSISNIATTATISLAAYAGQDIRIAFYGESTVEGGDNDLHIDNVTITVDSTVPQPTTYTVTLATANATMGIVTPAGATVVVENGSFTATANANNGYRFVNWTSNGNVVSSDNPYTFTVTADITLTANFESNGEPATCPAPSNVAVSNITSNSATISWTENGTATAWVIDYNGQTVNASTNPYTLTGLAANTSYTVAVMAVCSDEEQSEFGATYTFTTANVGIDDVNAASIGLYPNPASSTVTLKGIEGKATVTVVDMNGRESGKWSVNDGTLTIDVTKMAQGAYFVRIVGEQVNAIRKLIVK